MATQTVLPAPEGILDRVLRRLAPTRATLHRLIETGRFAAGPHPAPGTRGTGFVKKKIDQGLLHALTTGADSRVPSCDRYGIVKVCHDLAYPNSLVAPQHKRFQWLKDLWAETLNRAAELNLQTARRVLGRWVQQYRQRWEARLALARTGMDAPTDRRFN